ncbi:Crp/Fnr family transcriptional regulator [Bosea sp. Leaf344]|uniref:Crp/Fnr family transcriptional regulator n=1 Tax=Bosea sp. Leaf344 TaxID=1736346 RepID=UPI0009E7D9EC|nr:Crp/Fnr family transcriptional regulator [Bosea sp. Leaf344]
MTPLPGLAIDSLKHWPVRFPKGHLIFDEGDVSDCIYRLQRGCVRLQVNSVHGNRQIVQFVLPGDIFGLCPERRNTAAEAVTTVMAHRFSLKSVMEEGLSSPRISLELLRNATVAYQDLAHHIEKIVHLSAVEKVRDFYVWLDQRVEAAGLPPRRRPPMPQRDIADYLGMAPETLSRCIRQLRVARENEALDAA